MPLSFWFDHFLDSRAEILQIFGLVFVENLRHPKSHSEINWPIKLAVIYGTINEHEKANIGFKHCILAQEEKMINSGKFSNSLSNW